MSDKPPNTTSTYDIVTALRELGRPPGTICEMAADEIEQLREALSDMWAGWRYIRKHHGDLYGVGWDRCEDGAARALGRMSPYPSKENINAE